MSRGESRRTRKKEGEESELVIYPLGRKQQVQRRWLVPSSFRQQPFALSLSLGLRKKRDHPPVRDIKDRGCGLLWF
jgi:hypothetical protein